MVNFLLRERANVVEFCFIKSKKKMVKLPQQKNVLKRTVWNVYFLFVESSRGSISTRLHIGQSK